MQYTKILQKNGGWWLGWVKEVPGANTQGRTLEEAQSNLAEALELILDTYERR
jgi:predicted RNase H-like HicB family nuclease